MKKIWALCLIFVITLGFSACAHTPSVGIDSSALEPFVIGGIGPLTEDRGTYGQSVFQGASIAVEEINATGGVNGFRLILNFQDSKGDPETALTVYEKLKDNGMKVLLGGGFSDTSSALSEASAKDGILTLIPAASHSSALGTAGNAFRVCVSDVRLGTVTANFISDYRLAERVAVVWDGTPFGEEEQVQAFVSSYTGRGGFAELYGVSADDPDFTAVTASLQKGECQMVYLALSPENTVEFLKFYGNLGLALPLIGNSGLEAVPGGYSGAGVPDGTYTVTSFSPEDPSTLVQNFVANYREAYGTAPDRYAAEGYDAVYAVAEVLRKTGVSPDNGDGDDLGKKLISAMTKITVQGVSGDTSWTADGETTRSASVKVSRSGRQEAFVKDRRGT